MAGQRRSKSSAARKDVHPIAGLQLKLRSVHHEEAIAAHDRTNIARAFPEKHFDGGRGVWVAFRPAHAGGKEMRDACFFIYGVRQPGFENRKRLGRKCNLYG